MEYILPYERCLPPAISLTNTKPETPPSTPPEAMRVHPSPSRSPRSAPASGMIAASILTIVSIVVLIASIWELLHRDFSTGIAAVLALMSLLSFGLAFYGILRVILALIESAGERRRRTREFTERRLTPREQAELDAQRELEAKRET